MNIFDLEVKKPIISTIIVVVFSILLSLGVMMYLSNKDSQHEGKYNANSQIR